MAEGRTEDIRGSARTRRAALTLMFLASGVAGLVFETAVQRELSRTFGATAWATATVLAAFMAGTALGAVVLGGWADRTRHPLRLYAGLELGIAASALAMPRAVAALNALFVRWAHGAEPQSPRLVLLRVLLALLFLLVPTSLMGGTLPAACRGAVLLTQDSQPGRWVGRLYMANLFGAAAGALSSSYGLMPAFGLAGALGLGAACNGVAAWVALGLTRLEPPAAASGGPAAPPSFARPWLLAASAWSGFAAFAYEIVWTHLIGLVVGNSVYAFGLMLGIFLSGLSAGSFWAQRVPRRWISARLLGGVQLVTSVGVLLTLPLWEHIPHVFSLLGPHLPTFAGREVARGAACVAVVGLPAAALGAFYPLLLRITGDGASEVGHDVGGLSASNTAGAVAGSLGAGFFLLPVLGSRGLLDVLVVAGALVAALAFRGHPRLQLLAAAAAVGVALMPSWPLSRMTSGENVYFQPMYWTGAKLLFAEESVESGFTTAVEYPERSGHVVLLTNGKFQGNDTGEVRAQARFAQLPMLVQHGYGRALNIGVGTGCSLGTLAAQPFAKVEAAEISHDIIHAARAHFAAVNAHVLDNPAVTLHYADGRNLLLLTDQRYDLITVELTSIWIAGEADLYNHEFYEIVRRHLTPGGVLQQWVQLHHLSRRSLARILHTLRQTLPHVVLFAGGGQGQILASETPITLDYQAITELSERLRGSPATAFIDGGDLLTLYGELLLDEAGVGRFIAKVAADEGMAEAALLSTDDNLALEYETPKGNVLPPESLTALQAELRRFGPAALPIHTGGLPGAAAHIEAARRVGRRDPREVDQLLTRAIEDGAPAQPLKEWFTRTLANDARLRAAQRDSLSSLHH